MAKTIFVCVVLGLSLLVSSNGQRETRTQPDINERLKRIERQLRYLQNDIDKESIARRDGVRSIVDKLDSLESLSIPARGVERFLDPDGIEDVHGVVNKRKVNREKENKELLGMMKRLMQAFSEEKKINVELRRELREDMEVNQDYSTVLESFTQHLKEDFRSNIDRFRNDMMKIFEDKTCRSDYTSLSSDIKEVKDILCNSELVANECIDRNFSSCLDLLEHGLKDSKVYTIVVNNQPLRVYCDQETDGGGWTVFQRRQDGSVDLNRDWENYKNGFGDLEGEFWLGNDYIAELTRDCCHDMRADIGHFDGSFSFAKYSNFSVGNESTKYILFIDGYKGNAGNPMDYLNGQKFSTADNDNDGRNCASNYNSGFWYRQCTLTNPNGVYHNSGSMNTKFVHWTFDLVSLKYIDLKLR